MTDGPTTPQNTLRQILTTANLDPERADEIAIDGADPILPTALFMGAAGAASLGAGGLAAADIWKLRGGGDQHIAIDARSGAMATRTNMYLRLDEGVIGELWDPVSGFYETADHRWIQLHCNFPHHREGALRVLKCKNHRDAVAAAVKRWQGDDLDQVLGQEGLCAALVRTPQEWRNLDQAAAVSRLPLFEIIRIGDGPAEPFPANGERPLSGVRVLDLTRVLAGPTCGRTLAAHGAEVMRIASPNLPFIEPLVIDTGHGKLSAYVDLDTDGGSDTLARLIRQSDVFCQAYRPGSLAARGFSPEAMAALRPGIIYVTLSAYGNEGPWAGRRGFDTLVQSASGIADEQGSKGSPRHLPGQALDYVTGYLAAFGAMVALARRARDGGSYLVRLSLAQTGHWIDRLGRVESKDDPRTLHDPGFADVADLTIESDTSWGRLAHLSPLLHMSKTPPRWDRAAVRLGSHPPNWPR